MCCLSFYRLLFVESRRRRTFYETVITMVYDDMLMAADGGSLYLLDLSAAFDTVDHDLLVLMHAETRTSVRSERCRAPVVQFIPLW